MVWTKNMATRCGRTEKDATKGRDVSVKELTRRRAITAWRAAIVANEDMTHPEQRPWKPPIFVIWLQCGRRHIGRCSFDRDRREVPRSRRGSHRVLGLCRKLRFRFWSWRIVKVACGIGARRRWRRQLFGRTFWHRGIEHFIFDTVINDIVWRATKCWSRRRQSNLVWMPKWTITLKKRARQERRAQRHQQHGVLGYRSGNPLVLAALILNRGMSKVFSRVGK